MALKRLIGRGTEVWIAPLRSGESDTPFYSPMAPIVMVLAAATKGAVSLTFSTGSPVVNAASIIPKGAFLNVVTPSGKDLLVQVSSDTIGAVTAIPISGAPAAIPVGSTITYPLKLRLRKSASLDQSATSVETSDFDAGGYSYSITTKRSQGVKLDGDYGALDAAGNTIENCATEFTGVYLWELLPNPDASVYAKGAIYEGVCEIGSTPLEVPADGVMTANFELKPQGKLKKTLPTPLA